jgi:hypothetical protein
LHLGEHAILFLKYRSWFVGLTFFTSHAIVQAVASFLLWQSGFDPGVRSCGLCGGQSGSDVGFLRVLWFPLPILIPPNTPYSSSGAGTIDQFVADVPCLIPPYEIKKNNSAMTQNPIILWHESWKRRPLLGNGNQTRFCSNELHETIEELLESQRATTEDLWEMMFAMQSVPRHIRRTTGQVKSLTTVHVTRLPL